MSRLAFHNSSFQSQAGFRFWDSGVGFRDPGFGYRGQPSVGSQSRPPPRSPREAPSPRLAACRFGFRISGLVFRVSGFGFRVPGFGFRVASFVFRVSGFEFRVSGFGFRVSGIRFQVSRVGSHGLGIQFSFFSFSFCFCVLGFRSHAFGFHSSVRAFGCSGFSFFEGVMTCARRRRPAAGARPVLPA